MTEYLIRQAYKAHIWRNGDTACRLWSAGRMNKSRYYVAEECCDDICRLCWLARDGTGNRRDYYRKYYLANRERRIAWQLAYYHNNRDRIRANRKNTLKTAPWLVAAKVKRNWGVSLDEAKAMIECGRFPP